MNFDLFLDSDFYKKASYHFYYDVDTDSLRYIRGSYCIVSTNIPDNNLISDIEESPTFRNIYPDLYYLLYSSKLDTVYRNILKSQWLEVNNELSRYDIKPFMSYLLIVPPNTTISPHRHIGYSKHTISYIFNYRYNSECVHTNSQITVSDIEYTIPDVERILLSMENNPIHSAFNATSMWFIWVNEYKSIVPIYDQTKKIFQQLV